MTNFDNVLPFALSQSQETVEISISDVLEELFSVFVTRDPSARTTADEAKESAYVKECREAGINVTGGLTTPTGENDIQAAVCSLIWSMIGSWRFANDTGNELYKAHCERFTAHIAAFVKAGHGSALENVASQAFVDRKKLSTYSFDKFNVPTLEDVKAFMGEDREELEESSFSLEKGDMREIVQALGIEKPYIVGYMAGTHGTRGEPLVSEDATMEDCEKEIRASRGSLQCALSIYQKFGQVLPEAKRKVGPARRKLRDFLEVEQAMSLNFAWGAIVPSLAKEGVDPFDVESDFGYWLLLKLDKYLSKKQLLWTEAREDFATKQNLSGLNPRPGAVDRKRTDKAKGLGRDVTIYQVTRVDATRVSQFLKRVELTKALRVKIKKTLAKWEELENSNPASYSVSKETVHFDSELETEMSLAIAIAEKQRRLDEEEAEQK